MSILQSLYRWKEVCISIPNGCGLMDWKSELPSLTGIEKNVAEAAQKLMRGPVVFKSPYWDGNVVIETLDDYRAWIRTVNRVNNEPDAERRALEIWETEKNGKFEEG